MLIPLPDDLQSILIELHECAGIVHDSEYSADDRDRLKKLQAIGLVKLAWMLTPQGKSRLDSEKGSK